MRVGAVEVSQAILVAPVNGNINKTGQSQAVEDLALSSGQIMQMVDDMQNYINKMNISLEFSTYGDRGDKIAVTVADKETGEVIREIPPKEIRELYIKMSEVAGIIFNKEA